MDGAVPLSSGCWSRSEGSESPVHRAGFITWSGSHRLPECFRPLPALAQLKALQDETGTERDPAYVAANFVFLNKLQGMGLYVDRDGGFGGSLSADDVMAVIEENDVSGVATLEQPHFLLGYGVEDPESGIHGDEEYLYVVELPSRDPFDDSGDWTVKVSAHSGFPRWDGPTEEAFEQAAWQYEGPLSGAIEELVAEPV